MKNKKIAANRFKARLVLLFWFSVAIVAGIALGVYNNQWILFLIEVIAVCASVFWLSLAWAIDNL